MTRLIMLIVAASLVGLPQSSAWADGGGTVVLIPVRDGKVRPRYRSRIERSIAAALKGGGKKLSMSGQNAGTLTGTSARTCTLDPACLAKAGAKLGAARVVGVMVKTKRNQTFDITFVLVDVAATRELSRSTNKFVKARLTRAPGKLIKAFLSAAPAAAAPPPPAQPPPTNDPVAKPDPEPKSDPTPTPDPDPKPEANVDPKPESNPTPTPGPAVTTSAPALSNSGNGKKIHVGIQTGVVFPQLQSDLGTAIGGKIEAGMRVWKSLAPFVSVAYAQPGVESELMDPRVGNYTTTTTQRELTTTIGAMWRFLPAGGALNIYAAAGLRVWFLKTLTRGAVVAGSAFLQNTETSTRIGGALAGGAEYRVGPGAAVAEIDVGGSDLPHLITGDVTTTAVGVNIGYRLMF